MLVNRRLPLTLSSKSALISAIAKGGRLRDCPPLPQPTGAHPRNDAMVSAVVPLLLITLSTPPKHPTSRSCLPRLIWLGQRLSWFRL